MFWWVDGSCFLVDVVLVVVKRCKEEQATLHLSLYDRSSRFFPAVYTYT